MKRSIAMKRNFSNTLDGTTNRNLVVTTRSSNMPSSPRRATTTGSSVSMMRRTTKSSLRTRSQSRKGSFQQVQQDTMNYFPSSRSPIIDNDDDSHLYMESLLFILNQSVPEQTDSDSCLKAQASALRGILDPRPQVDRKQEQVINRRAPMSKSSTPISPHEKNMKIVKDLQTHKPQLLKIWNTVHQQYHNILEKRKKRESNVLRNAETADTCSTSALCSDDVADYPLTDDDPTSSSSSSLLFHHARHLQSNMSSFSSLPEDEDEESEEERGGKEGEPICSSIDKENPFTAAGGGCCTTSTTGPFSSSSTTTLTTSFDDSAINTTSAMNAMLSKIAITFDENKQGIEMLILRRYIMKAIADDAYSY